ncbi:MAG: hypothetical protein MRJ68_16930 [Nitrospira sp.]|nr:hypothetical protein [Nitrospira sp.]
MSATMPPSNRNNWPASISQHDDPNKGDDYAKSGGSRLYSSNSIPEKCSSEARHKELPTTLQLTGSKSLISASVIDLKPNIVYLQLLNLFLSQTEFVINASGDNL